MKNANICSYFYEQKNRFFSDHGICPIAKHLTLRYAEILACALCVALL